MNNSHRYIAYRILYIFFKTHKSYRLLLEIELNKSEISYNDKRLILNLSKGIFRNKNVLDIYISKYSSTALDSIDLKTLIFLYLGIYELIFCDFIPNYATINTIVEICKNENHKAHKYVNAILRKISKLEENIISFDKNNFNNYLSNKYSYPKWLVDKLINLYPSHIVEKLCQNSLCIPSLCLRVNNLLISVKDLKKILNDNNIKYLEDKINYLYLVIKKFDKKNIIINLINEGLIYIQNPSSGFIIDYFNPSDNDIILDACCAPGGKASYIAQLTNNLSTIKCLDISSNRLKKTKTNLSKLNINIHKYILGSVITYKTREKYTKILIDVPCSSSGTLRKNPDIKWGLEEKDINIFTKLQYNILNNLSKYLIGNGEIMYSTCSVFKEENEEIINKFLSKNSNFSISPYKENKLKKYINKLGGLTILPVSGEYEGVFAVKMIKND